MVLIILGVLVILASAAGFYFMQRTKSELYAMIGTETLSIPELERLRGISDELGAQGGFRQVSEVVGAASPRPEGPLVAQVSQAPCVWYRYEIERQYEHVEYRDGRRYRSKRTEKVAGQTSSEFYALIDGQGNTIGVDPAGANPEGVEQSVDRFEPQGGSGQSVGFLGFTLPSSLLSRDGTIGFRYQEWLIRPGRELYILGEVHDKSGPLVIGPPDGKGHHIIAARTEEELRASRVQRHKFLAIGVIAAFIAGVILLVFGIVNLF